MSCFAPVGILCNDRADVLYISGRAGKYLEPAPGEPPSVEAPTRRGLTPLVRKAVIARFRHRVILDPRRRGFPFARYPSP